MMPLEELLRGPHLATARKLLAVEDLPRYDDLMALVGYLDHFPLNKQLGRDNELRWASFCRGRDVFHAFCYEFIEGLAAQIKALHVTGPVVEVAAGNGKLSHWLNAFGLSVIATDDYSTSWYIQPRVINPQYVERLTHAEALRKYKPELVIGCWLPYRSTIALDALDAPSVKSYIDIGEGKHGCTGSDQLWEREGLSASLIRQADQFSVSRTQCSTAFLFTKTGIFAHIPKRYQTEVNTMH
ncbi:TPA: hypothetical protein HA231_01610 [Candidatus Woesearchaeota archaeon]|nr:hypothetical protein [Candidatus Woesearchaeota archaeon]